MPGVMLPGAQALGTGLTANIGFTSAGVEPVSARTDADNDVYRLRTSNDGII